MMILSKSDLEAFSSGKKIVLSLWWVGCKLLYKREWKAASKYLVESQFYIYLEKLYNLSYKTKDENKI